MAQVMSIIRVAIASEHITVNWMGGVNYFRNLITAVNRMPNKKIHIVLLAGEKSDLLGLEKLTEVIRTPLLDSCSIVWKLRKLTQHLLHKDFLLYQKLKKENIDVLTHSSYLWKGCDIPSMPWIPDFQYKHIPDLYDESSLKKLEERHRKLAKYSDALVLSSFSAEEDFKTFFSDIKCDLKKLQFAVLISEIDINLNQADLVAKYKLAQPRWFHLPNQFWKHKNHSVVIEALRVLKEKGQEVPLVVATGNTKDARDPNLFHELKGKVKEYGLERNFVILGIIPYTDMLAFMSNSIAVINPSFFEGWSSTVEESKSLGKLVILSDIIVHKEQRPFRSVYFNPIQESELAIILDEVFNSGMEKERELMEEAVKKRVGSSREFAEKYQEIIFSLLN